MVFYFVTYVYLVVYDILFRALVFSLVTYVTIFRILYGLIHTQTHSFPRTGTHTHAQLAEWVKAPDSNPRTRVRILKRPDCEIPLS